MSSSNNGLPRWIHYKSWKSKTFSASPYLTSKASRNKTAYNTYAYDPLEIVISQAHSMGMKVDAWMNPYRITYSKFLNPASQYSTKRINKAVSELKQYNLDGIHFDDYFYSSKSKYISPTSTSYDNLNVTGSTTTSKPSAKTRRSNVNKMVKSVYNNVHEKIWNSRSATRGIYCST